jgi:uncharacterized protein (TIGR03435 family)
MKSLLLATACVAGAGSTVVGVTDAPSLQAQSSATQASSPAFEVVSIKPHKPDDVRFSLSFQPGGRFTMTANLRGLIQTAYQRTSDQLEDFQISGGPSWFNSDRFDILAKAENSPPVEEMRLMLRTLLADRFKLTVHHETRELPIYALVLARSDGRLGPTLSRARVDHCAPVILALGEPLPAARQPGDPCGGKLVPGYMTGGGTMLGLANALTAWVNRIVLDQTGLNGKFDFYLAWTPEHYWPELRPAGLPPIDPNGPSIFTALQEQLGLKLESTKAPFDVLVIDHVEQPSPD